MAVIAFAAAAQAAGGVFASSVGIAVAGAVGSYIDQTLIFPAIFGQDNNIEGPKLDDLQVSVASEGSPSMFAIGEAVPVNGTVIWTPPDFTETRTTSGGGGGKGFGGGGGGGTSTTYSYSISCAVRMCETDDLPDGKIVRVKKIWANDKVLYDYDAGATEEDREDTRYESIEFYLGDQVVNDPTIESIEGAASTVPYNGSAYFVLEELQLADFGDRIPNFKVLVEATATGQTIADAISRLCLRAGLLSTDIDVTGVTGTTLGIVSAGDQPVAAVLESMMVAYDLIVYEDNGKLVFQDRSSQSSSPVDEDDLAAYEIGEAPGDRPYKILREQFTTRKLPKRVTVQFTDEDCEYERSTRTATKTNTANSELRRIELPLTLNQADASEIALRMLWIQWGVRDSAEFSLPPSYIGVNAGDLVTVVDDGDTELVRLQSVQRGNNLMVLCRGVIEEPDIYDQNAIPSARSCIPPSDIAAIADGQAMMVVTDHQLGLPGENIPGTGFNDGEGIHIAFSTVSDTSAPRRSRTAAIYEANETDGNYRFTGMRQEEAIMGHLSVELAAPLTGGDTGEFFVDQEFEITVYGDEWTPNLSATIEDILAGDNQIVIQDENGSPELVSFLTCSANGVDGSNRRKYTCSNLIRGERATKKNAQVWPVDTNWILATEFTLNQVTIDTEFGTMRTDITDRYLQGSGFWRSHDESYWKADTPTHPLATLTGTRADIETQNSKLYPPTNARCQWNSGGDCTMMWRRRSWKITSGALHRGSHPWITQPESYTFDVDIYNPAGTEVVRTLQVRNLPYDVPTQDVPNYADGGFRAASGLASVQYTAAQQAEDGYTGGIAAIVANGIKADIYHLTGSGIRGYPLEVVFRNGMVV